MVITHEKVVYRLNLQVVFMGWVWGRHQQVRVLEVVIRGVVHEKASLRQGWKTMKGNEVSLVVMVINLI
jgi:hypothetical protein